MALRIVTVTYADGEPRVDRVPIAATLLEPLRILADLQLVYWPAAALRRGLPAEVRLEERDKPRSRAIYKGDQLIVEIEYQPGETVLRQPNRGYEIRLTQANGRF